jgi:NosR/NirI family nitrous oxide reductase transcriptional regulator
VTLRHCWAKVKTAGLAICTAIMITCFMAVFADAFSQNRFPRPEFQGGYTQPTTVFPAARPELYSILDAGVLLATLLLAAWFALKLRSRKGLFWLSLFCLAYFGFYRKGCICPVGSIQNVSQAIFDPTFALPIIVGIFFGLPIVFSLLFGRVFCASVCPLGALQDLFVLKPIRVNSALSSILGLLPHLYLGAAILFAATGAGFVICQFDPFVGFFRLSASMGMVLWGAGILALGLFIARPYCRYLCPLGVVLGYTSMLSRRHVTITPDTCINCRLCENACPFGAIRMPTITQPKEPRARSVKRVLVYGALLPVWIFCGACGGYLAGDALSLVHHRVRLAEQALWEESAAAGGATLESRTFRAGNVPLSALVNEAKNSKQKMKTGGALLGVYLGLVIGLGLVRHSLQRRRNDYALDPQTCMSCGRCFDACPQEQQRKKKALAAKDTKT